MCSLNKGHLFIKDKFHFLNGILSRCKWSPATTGSAGPSMADLVAIDGPAGPSMAAICMDGLPCHKWFPHFILLKMPNTGSL